ncbi:MAG: hypothetical protein J1F12_00430 [Muribaculaceae bacterium]|nr:hypothetical protein [Muribaculaceae bacterium]
MLDKKIIYKIEEKVGHKITTTDCIWLSKEITDKTNRVIGETTLKRMWGYTSDKNRKPHRSTLDIIAEFLGYKDYNTLAIDLELPEIVISDFEERDAIETDTLNIGDIVELSYLPNRLFSLKYVGDSRFIIETVDNSRNLIAGDIVKITHIEKGLPLYIPEVFRDGKNLGAYEAAKNGGLTSIEVLS